MLSIEVLGKPRISIDNAAIEKLPLKATGLLVYLAMQPGRIADRDRLADLLWPYQQSEQSLHSLRNCLLQLRKQGIRAHLEAEFRTCRLVDVITDFEQFERLAGSTSIDDLAAAAELYTGEFLDGVAIASEPFEDWMAARRERTFTLVRDVLGRLAEAYGRVGELFNGIATGRRLVQLDPICEVGHEALINAYLSAGQRGEAMRQYLSCANILHRELGVAPNAAIQKLVSGMRRSSNAISKKAAPEPLLLRMRLIEEIFQASNRSKRPSYKRSQMIEVANVLTDARRALGDNTDVPTISAMRSSRRSSGTSLSGGAHQETKGNADRATQSRSHTDLAAKAVEP